MADYSESLIKSLINKVKEYPRFSKEEIELRRKCHSTLKKVENDYEFDIHGVTLIEAKLVLEEAILGAWETGLRLILVITGKGLRQSKSNDLDDSEATGILRRIVPRWLKEEPLSNFVLAFSSAQQTHGGSGALYVLLRRQIGHHDKG